MSKIFLLSLISLLITGCITSPYILGGKKFQTKESAYTHQKSIMNTQINKIEPGNYFGGSLLIHQPSDDNLTQAPFISGNPTDDEKTFFLGFFKNDFNGIKDAINKSHMFDSVNVIQKSSYLRYAKNHGYRYLLVNNGDSTWTLFDVYLDLDKTVRFPKGLDNLIYLIEDTVAKFEIKKSTKSMSAKYKPVRDKLEYNDITRRGTLSIHGKGIEARSWMLTKIGEIASTKNILLKAGEKPKAGYFLILNEKIENNVFTIEFEATY